MYRVCIALIDATRARLFTFDRAADEAGLHEQLVEHSGLVNPVGRARASEQLTAAKPDPRWTDHARAALNAHRSHHASRPDAEFARTALAALREVIDDDEPQRVVLCADPRMLETLRTSAAGILPERLPVEELAMDLVTLSPAELRTELVFHGLLPWHSPAVPRH